MRGLASGEAGEGAGGDEEGEKGEEDGEKRGEGGEKKGVEGEEGGASEEKTEHAGGAGAADKAAEHGRRSVGTSVDSVDSDEGDGDGDGDGDGASGNGSNHGLLATRSGEIGLGAWCSNLLSHVPDDDELVHRAIARRQQQILV